TILQRMQEHSIVLESVDKNEKNQKLEILLGNSVEEVEVESIEVTLDTAVGEDLKITDVAYIRGTRVDAKPTLPADKISQIVNLDRRTGGETRTSINLQLLKG